MRWLLVKIKKYIKVNQKQNYPNIRKIKRYYEQIKSNILMANQIYKTIKEIWIVNKEKWIKKLSFSKVDQKT